MIPELHQTGLALAFSLMIATTCFSSDAPAIAEAPAPTQTFVHDTAEILIPKSTKTLEVALDSDSLGRQLHAVLGYYGGEIDRGKADVGVVPSGLVVGSASNHFQGYAVWKFRFENGDSRPCRIVAETVFIGTPSEQASGCYLAVTPSIDLAQGTVISPTDEETGRIRETSSAFGTYPEKIELQVPPGQSEFLIILADAGGSGTLRLESLRMEFGK
jgi:hypothetical protein